MWKKIWLRDISRGTNSSFWIKWVGLHVEHLLLIGLCMWLNKTRNDTSANRCDLLVNMCCTNEVCICMCMLCKRLCLRSICLLGNLGFGGLQKVVRFGPYSNGFNYLSFPFADEFFKLFRPSLQVGFFLGKRFLSNKHLVRISDYLPSLCRRWERSYTGVDEHFSRNSLRFFRKILSTGQFLAP